VVFTELIKKHKQKTYFSLQDKQNFLSCDRILCDETNCLWICY